ncbi:MAG: hypothetical protein Q4G23_11355, partial [Clostridia bacterium]|nr:hypothetical protein [Clostridia bacterium]
MFSKEAIIYSVAGIGIVAVISIIFYFSTGGTLSSIAENLPNMFGSSEHITDSAPLTKKLTEIFNAINKVSFEMPYLLPILLIALAADKKRKTMNHRLVYLFAALSLGILYGFGILYTNQYKTACFSLPFAVFSLVCYILTENKRKPFFYLMWLPCVIFATIGLFTSNTVLFIAGAVFSVSNVAGIFFAYDLYKEIKTAMINSKTKAVRSKKLKPVAKSLFIIAFAFQLFGYMLAIQYFQITNTSGLVKV